MAPANRLAAGAGSGDYRLLLGVRQPHLQFVDWQRHAPLGHPQEQLAQSQAPQQVVVAAVWSGTFFRYVIVFSSVFFSASCALKGADVRLPETLQRCLRNVGLISEPSREAPARPSVAASRRVSGVAESSGVHRWRGDSNLTPGPIAVLATFAGHRLGGFAGALNGVRRPVFASRHSHAGPMP
jgi:hypothetical protein